jgi:hypothetical protein
VNDLKHARKPIRDLVKQLEFRSTFGRPCYLKRNTVHAALIVPMLRNGADGPYSYVKTYQRATVHEAIVLGYITLGPDLGVVPEFAVASTHWSASPDLFGRTISLRGGGQ